MRMYRFLMLYLSAVFILIWNNDLLAQDKQELTQPKVPQEQLLNRDGTLSLESGFHGSIDPAGDKPSSFFGRSASNSAAVCADNSDFLLKWGYASGTKGNEIITPVDIAFDSQGNAYVVDIFIQKVTVFDPNGNFVTKWGQTGKGPVLFNSLEVEIYDDQAYLLTQNGVDVFDLQGGLHSQYGSDLQKLRDGRGREHLCQSFRERHLKVQQYRNVT